MVYLLLDTCVWLDLLNANFETPDNLFDELMYFVENNQVTCITTKNINREWERSWSKRKKRYIDEYSLAEKHLAAAIYTDPALPAMDRPLLIAEKLELRITRVSHVLASQCEIAGETDAIYIQAAQKNLNVLPPNHVKDSFRDTVNILSLAEHIRMKGYTNCYFVTSNHEDFAAGREKKIELIEGLTDIFRQANMEYVHFENNGSNRAGLFRNIYKRNSLPSFTDHLKELRRQKEAVTLAVRRDNLELPQPFEDSEFLDNIQYLDLILSRNVPSAIDKKVLDMLFKRHEGYRKYFMQKLDPDGLV